MTKTKKKSKHESESDSSSSSSSSSSSDSDSRRKKSKKLSKSKDEHKDKDEKQAHSKWESPGNPAKASSSRHEEKRRERRKSNDERDPSRSRNRDDERDPSRNRNRDDERDTSRNRNPRDDDRKYDSNRRRSPERRDDNRRNRNSPQERRRYDNPRDDRRGPRDDRRDFRDQRRDDDRRKRSHSKERPPFNDRKGGGGFKQRRFNNKEEDDGNYEWGKRDMKKDPDEEPVEKDKPNFGLSGKLTEETNKFKGVVIKYAEPPEAKKPKRRWRFYPFKGETALPTLYVHRQSAYLIGRDRKICDIAVDHPSCSKQHAVLQYRLVPYEREDGTTGKRVRPYIIDLESANGTFINNKQIEAKKYVELLEKDVAKFGFSSREYVMLHETSKDEAEDDEVADDDEPETEPAPAAT